MYELKNTKCRVSQLPPVHKRTDSLYKEELTNKSLIGWHGQKMPEEVMVNGQDFNDYYGSIDQSLRKLMTTKNKLEHLKLEQLKFLSSDSSIPSLVESPQQKELNLELETLDDKIEKLKDVKKGTKKYLETYCKVENKKRAIQASQQILSVIDEQLDEVNKVVSHTYLWIKKLPDDQDKVSGDEEDISSKSEDPLSYSSNGENNLKPGQPDWDLLTPRTKIRNVTRQVIPIH